jgi:hypothetical protein
VKLARAHIFTRAQHHSTPLPLPTHVQALMRALTSALALARGAASSNAPSATRATASFPPLLSAAASASAAHAHLPPSSLAGKRARRWQSSSSAAPGAGGGDGGSGGGGGQELTPDQLDKLRRMAEDIGKNVEEGTEEMRGLYGKEHAEKVRRQERARESERAPGPLTPHTHMPRPPTHHSSSLSPILPLPLRVRRSCG